MAAMNECVRLARASRVVVFACAATGVLVLGCAPPKPPIEMDLPTAALQVHDQPEITKDGLTVSVTVIGPSNYRSFPQIFKKTSWTSSETNPLNGREYQVERTGTAFLIPTPNFQVRIANHTGHVVKFTQVVFRLQDNAGQSYQIFGGASELVALQNLLWSTAIGPDAAAAVMPKLTPAINQLQLLNRNLELLNGDEWTGYLVFNMNLNSSQDYDNMLARTERLTLRMAEVPIEMNEAGGVKRTTEFTFVLDKVVKSMKVKCPADTEKASLDVCSPT